MVVADNTYSRVVAVLKVILPLAALGLLATLFLFARSPVQDSAIPYAEIEDIARDPRISGPEITGVTDDGSVVTISADAARPENGEVIVEGIALDIDAFDGTDIRLTAREGRVDTAEQSAYLGGLARLVTSNGYSMETAGLNADLASGVVTSEGPLEVQTPFGSLTAGKVTVQTGGGGTGAQMVFNEGVRLIYDPQSEESDP